MGARGRGKGDALWEIPEREENEARFSVLAVTPSNSLRRRDYAALQMSL